MRCRFLAIAIATLSSTHVMTASAQSLYAAPNGAYVGGGTVYVIPAPGSYAGQLQAPYPAPTVAAPPDGYVAAAPLVPDGYCYDYGYGATPPYGSDPAYGGCGLAEYGYAPGYLRNWYPVVEYDSSGAPFFRGELGWQGGPPSGAPANPCTLGQRQQNRC
jgi:hypothetical protein